MSKAPSNAETVHRPTEQERLVEAVRRRGGLATRRELDQEGFSHRAIASAVQEQFLSRTSRGLYKLSDLVPYGDLAFGQAALLFPEGVIALVSALVHHGLTTQIPDAVDVAVPRRYTRNSPEIGIRLVVMPSRLLHDGVERARGESGVRFRVFSRERAVCDAFRYKQIVGEDVAYEALRNYVTSSNVDTRALLKAAEVTETSNVILPVLKTLRAS